MAGGKWLIAAIVWRQKGRIAPTFGKRYVLAPLVISSFLASPALAAPGRCVLRVEGHTYLNGPCNIDLEPGGDFEISPLREVNPYYFAYVTLTGSPLGTAMGSWNGKDAENHAHDDLGTLTRKGACWSNARAEICATAR
jgi:hypothetical protein